MYRKYIRMWAGHTRRSIFTMLCIRLSSGSQAYDTHIYTISWFYTPHMRMQRINSSFCDPGNEIDRCHLWGEPLYHITPRFLSWTAVLRSTLLKPSSVWLNGVFSTIWTLFWVSQLPANDKSIAVTSTIWSRSPVPTALHVSAEEYYTKTKRMSKRGHLNWCCIFIENFHYVMNAGVFRRSVGNKISTILTTVLCILTKLSS